MENNNLRSEEEIFVGALVIDAPDELAAYLDEACGEDAQLRRRVEGLLRRHRDTIAAPPIREQAGAVIGRYKLLQEIGEGGFGVVYMAEQREPVKRKVALKVIKLGMDTRQVIARFEAERQALAMMDHPNIAKVLDAGATPSGRPYFVMELVRGVPITDYCDTHNVDMRARQELFIPVCQAIQHAHQKGIIHRDIKPSNIMVTLHDGLPVPMVIDFGVAKATSTQLTEKTLFTRYEQMIGTPAYMSPEQAEMSGLDIDTRSDIYSLGVLLYELLTGTTPFSKHTLASAAVGEIQRIIREEEPPKPSTRLSDLSSTSKGGRDGSAAGAALRTSVQDISRHRHTDPVSLRRFLRGDLDWIIMKCLEKDRGRRYETANGLANDIRRHLNDEPVVAGPPGAGYRLRKFIRRHRAAFAAGSVVTLGLVIGLLATAYGFVAARSAERVAVAARDAADNARDAADSARQLAEEERDRADRHAEVLRRRLYASQIRSIGAAIDESNFRGIRNLLESCPEDLRHWEWQRLAWRLADRSVRTLPVHEGHDGRVFDAVVSPDGERLLTGGADGALSLWSLSTGRVVQSLPGHDDEVHAVDWSADGRYVLSADDELVRLWETATGRQLRQWTVAPFADHEISIAVSPDGARVVVGRKYGPCEVFDVGTTEPVAELPRFAEAAVFSPDGDAIAFNANPYRVSLLDLNRGRIHEFPRENQWVHAVTFSPDGRWIVSGNEDKTVRIWDVAGGKARLTLRGHQDSVWAVAVSPDRTQVASAGADQTVRLWDAATGEPLAVFLGHDASVRRVFFTPDGDQVVSFDKSGTVKLWETASAPDALTLSAHPQSESHALGVAFRPDGRQLASSGSDTAIRLWDPDTGRLLRTLTGHTGWTFSLAYRPPDGGMLASADDRGSVRLWDTRTGRLLRTIQQDVDKGGWAWIRGIAFSPDGTRMVTACETDATIRVWDPDTAGELLRLYHPGLSGTIAFSPDGRWIAAGDKGGALLLRDATTGEILRTLAAPTGLECLAFNPAGTQVAAGGQDGIVRVWDTSTGNESLALNSFGGEVASVVFSPDGQRIFCALRDNTVRVWSVTGEELLILRGHRNRVRSVALSPDGRTVASSASDGTIRLWETGPPPSGYDPRRIVLTAATVVGALREEYEWTFQAIDAVESDQTMDPSVRDEALRFLYGDCFAMNERSWSIVRLPGKTVDEYLPALREAEAGIRANPDDGNLINTLGVAQYRAGRYADALETLLRSSARQEAPRPEDAAFLAMAHYQLGHERAAREMLATLHGMMQEKRWAGLTDPRNFLREADELIGAGDVE